MLIYRMILAGGAFALSAGFAVAETSTGHEGHMNMTGMPDAMQGYMGAMRTMMADMPAESSGDPDADFLLMMIPHHQSAIDMARQELGSGDDPATRTMAQRIIEAQEAEIAEMRAMLQTMGVALPAD